MSLSISQVRASVRAFVPVARTGFTDPCILLGVSAQWHPFSISSFPLGRLDSRDTFTLHMLNMGRGTFTAAAAHAAAQQGDGLQVQFLHNHAHFETHAQFETHASEV